MNHPNSINPSGPTEAELDEIEADRLAELEGDDLTEEEAEQTSRPLLAAEDPLEDLFLEAQTAGRTTPKIRREADPASKHSLDAAAKRMKDLYSLPENWERTRGIVLLDRKTSTLIGNFSEYLHKSIPGTRKLVREHSPIPIDATEYCDGYLGSEMDFRLGRQSWDLTRHAECHLLLSELMVEAPAVAVVVHARLGAIIRVDLQQDTQFASSAGNTLLLLPAGTNVYPALGQDSRLSVRKAIGI